MAPQLGGGQRYNYSTKTRQAGCANEQSMYSLMSMVKINKFLIKVFIGDDISLKISNVKLTSMTFVI